MLGANACAWPSGLDRREGRGAAVLALVLLGTRAAKETSKARQARVCCVASAASKRVGRCAPDAVSRR